MKKNKSKLTLEELERIIQDIMINDGPDGHCDGSDVIAEFIKSIIEGKHNDWLKDYFINKGKNSSYFDLDTFITNNK